MLLQLTNKMSKQHLNIKYTNLDAVHHDVAVHAPGPPGLDGHGVQAPTGQGARAPARPLQLCRHQENIMCFLQI